MSTQICEILMIYNYSQDKIKIEKNINVSLKIDKYES
jgi:hypothetical protein